MSVDHLWVEKYRPKDISDILGNKEAKTAFIDWLKSKKRRKKAVLLYGPAGVGKTALVNAVANQFGYLLIEMNASDTRTKNAINKIGKPATSYLALDNFTSKTKGNILFLDEVDGVFGQQDRGGIPAIIKIVNESLVPVIMAANDPDLQKIRPLRKVSKLIRFQKIRLPLIITLLQKICERENIKVEFEALERIALNSQGDVRSAINDLQSIVKKEKIVTLKDTLLLSNRTQDINLFDTLRGMFSAKSTKEAAKILNYSNVNFDNFLLSISDNLPLRYSDLDDLANAYDLLSRADMFRGRVGVENWSLLKYFFNLVAQSATVSPESFKPFEFIYPPLRIIKLFWTKSQRIKLDSISLKIARKLHISKITAKKEVLPFIKILLEKEKTSPIASSFELDLAETDYIIKMKKL
ncbi:MAG: replication factor C large subunit [Candidatus Bathyarchaeota archaeon]|nr:replication factor C large subunit [Candidatus Bathyarchaeota archaeon]